MRPERREFLKSALAAALGGSACWRSALAQRADSKTPSLPARSAVYQTYSKRSLRGTRLDADVVREMLDRAMMKWGRCEQPVEAWKKVASPADRVGIKVNCIGRNNLSTHPEVALAIVEGLRSAGVDPQNVVIFDREESELNDAGYRPAAVGQARISHIAGYSARIQFPFGSTRLAQILDDLTVLINAPVLKDHQLAGVTIAMKNLSHGLCENPMDFHGNNCEPGISHFFGADPIQKKLRLNICDAVIGAFDGGPTGMTNAGKWPCGSLLVSADAVALDRVGMDLIEARRRERGLMSLTRRGTPPRQIIAAAKLGLGNYLPGKFELVRTEI